MSNFILNVHKHHDSEPRLKRHFPAPTAFCFVLSPLQFVGYYAFKAIG